MANKTRRRISVLQYRIKMRNGDYRWLGASTICYESGQPKSTINARLRKGIYDEASLYASGEGRTYASKRHQIQDERGNDEWLTINEISEITGLTWGTVNYRLSKTPAGQPHQKKDIFAPLNWRNSHATSAQREADFGGLDQYDLAWFVDSLAKYKGLPPKPKDQTIAAMADWLQRIIQSKDAPVEIKVQCDEYNRLAQHLLMEHRAA